MPDARCRPWSALDDLLHGSATPSRGIDRNHAGFCLGCIVVLGAVFGAAIGSFGELRLLQVLYSATKVPILLLLSLSVTIPSIYAVSALCGMGAAFPTNLRSILDAQVGITACLAALAPFTLLWYASNTSYAGAKVFNAMLFAVALGYGWLLLRRRQRDAPPPSSGHRILMLGWIMQFGFVAVQLAWVLRPFIGHPDRPTRYLREEAWGNAYVLLTRMVIDTLGW